MNAAAQCESHHHEHGLAHACAGRLQDRGHGHAARVGQTFEVDHLFAQGDDKRIAQHPAGNACKYHEHGVEFGMLQDVQGRDREHHTGRRAVDRTGDGLVDVVLHHAVTPQQPPEDAEAQNGGQF